MLLLLLLRLIIVGLIVYAFIYVVKTIKNTIKGTSGPSKGFFTTKPEECPVCRQPLKITKDDFYCPSCGSRLGRSKEGKLLVKIN